MACNPGPVRSWRIDNALQRRHDERGEDRQQDLQDDCRRTSHRSSPTTAPSTREAATSGPRAQDQAETSRSGRR